MTHCKRYLMGLATGLILIVGQAQSAAAAPPIHPHNSGKPIGWDWWKTYPWSPYNAWKNPYWYPPYNKNYPFPPDQAYPYPGPRPYPVYPIVLPYVVPQGSADINVTVPQADPTRSSTPRPTKGESRPTLTAQQERERLQKQELAWSRSNLPVDQTASGRALNILLADLQRLLAQGVQRPDIQIDEAILPSINVVVGGHKGNIGVLKHEGRIDWPTALRAAEFETERQQIESSISKIIDKAISAEAVNLEDLTGTLAGMRGRLAGKIQELPAAEYIRAKRTLNHLDDAVKLLRQPDARNYFDQTYAAKGQTVAQLVEHMTRYNLQFAPAVEGGEPAYAALHRALVQYDLAINSGSSVVVPDSPATASDNGACP